MLLQSIKEKRWLITVNILFVIIYSLICFVNHYNYRTYALDLGAYTRTLSDYAHFHASYGEVFRAHPENVLSDHFDLLLMLFSPLWWIFGEITLLVVQLAAITLGSIGVHKLAKHYGLADTTALMVAVIFLSYFGVFSAVAFDYHSSVVAACALPWMVYFIVSKSVIKALITYLFMLIAKENESLWLFFIFTAAAWLFRYDRKTRLFTLTLAVVSVLYFLLIIFVVMPSFSSRSEYSHFEFHVLGKNFHEAIVTVFSQPVDSLALLFKNHLPDASLDHIKTETWVFWLVGGGFLMFVRPVFLWMIIPVMMQKMYHDDPAKWSVAQQYNIEFAPLLAWCVIDLTKSSRARFQLILCSITLISVSGITTRLCDNTVGFVDKTRIRFYQSDHYQSDFNRSEVRQILEMIPDTSAVSAQSMFIPHLLHKKAVYQYPIKSNASYFLLSEDIHAWPLTASVLRTRIDSLSRAQGVTTVCVKSGVYLFKIQSNPVY